MNMFFKNFLIFSSASVMFVISINFIQASGFTLQIDSAPESLNLDEEGETKVSFLGDSKYYSGKTYFLRLAFSSEGSTNYFGFTKNNNDEWIAGSDDKSKYFQFQTSSEATWSGTIKVKNDLTSSYFSNSDSYQLRVGRYTSSNDSSADWSGPIWVNLVGPTPSPTPEPTLTPTPVPKPTPLPTPIKTVIPQPTLIPTRTPMLFPSPTPTSISEIETVEPMVLGENVVMSTPVILKNSPQPKETKGKFPVESLLFAGGGAFLIGFSLYSTYKYSAYKKTKVTES